MAQLVFDLGHRPAQGRDDFFVTPCNAEFVGWIDKWPDWPNAGLAIWGPPASGKTHLAEVWRAKSGAKTVDIGVLHDTEPPAVLNGHRNLVIDLGKAADLAAPLEEPLLHLHNIIVEQGGNLVITSRNPPSRWQVALADLSSRLRAMGAVAIALPDDELLTAVLAKQFADRQLTVGADVFHYALTRMERSFEAANTLVAMVDREALTEGKRISVPLLRRVLDRLAVEDD